MGQYTRVDRNALMGSGWLFLVLIVVLVVVVVMNQNSGELNVSNNFTGVVNLKEFNRVPVVKFDHNGERKTLLLADHLLEQAPDRIYLAVIVDTPGWEYIEFPAYSFSEPLHEGEIITIEYLYQRELLFTVTLTGLGNGKYRYEGTMKKER